MPGEHIRKLAVCRFIQMWKTRACSQWMVVQLSHSILVFPKDWARSDNRVSSNDLYWKILIFVLRFTIQKSVFILVFTEVARIQKIRMANIEKYFVNIHILEQNWYYIWYWYLIDKKCNNKQKKNWFIPLDFWTKL